jgi:hypothetical protein
VVGAWALVDHPQRQPAAQRFPRVLGMERRERDARGALVADEANRHCRWRRWLEDEMVCDMKSSAVMWDGDV